SALACHPTCVATVLHQLQSPPRCQERREQMLIFGNPKAGTPLLQSVPAAGLDLPLKALVWEDAEGSTQVAYNDPQYIIRRHGLDAALAANLAAVLPLIERAALE
ncbi:MAG: DUF302 domain-containing protein, partial [Gammaproteobacteria bacterium]|nr:DUF302 domain-containing protein [Gammaproteobacteria bacterium]